jgi:hypothetical protein
LVYLLFYILISNVDKQKLESVANSIRSGFGFSTGGATVLDGGSGVLEEDLMKPKSSNFSTLGKLGLLLEKMEGSNQNSNGTSRNGRIKNYFVWCSP